MIKTIHLWPTQVSQWLHGVFSARPYSRLIPLDALRGFIMIVMALDHANSFIARGMKEFEIWAFPFHNYQGTVLPFLTRFVTHLAAPGFFFLMGAGMVLFAESRRRDAWKEQRIMSHFFIRGLLLIALQFLLENPAWRLGHVEIVGNYFGVLYCLGGCMLLGALFLYLPVKWLLGLSLLLIAVTEPLLHEVAKGFSGLHPLLLMWLVPGHHPPQGLFGEMFVLYPIMPWLGVLGLGMAYGHWLARDKEKAMKSALYIGIIVLVLFIPFRVVNGFGNIRPQSGEGLIAFLNVIKYPPSIVFLLLTLGSNFILLGLFARLVKRDDTGMLLLSVFGRAPLFFYCVHLYMYSIAGQLINPKGIGIPWMYPCWFVGLLILFPLCWLYGRLKQSRPPQSIVRLF